MADDLGYADLFPAGVTFQRPTSIVSPNAHAGLCQLGGAFRDAVALITGRYQ
jgi:hypothetical protein